MNDFDYKKYLSEGRLLKESVGSDPKYYVKYTTLDGKEVKSELMSKREAIYKERDLVDSGVKKSSVYKFFKNIDLNGKPYIIDTELDKEIDYRKDEKGRPIAENKLTKEDELPVDDIKKAIRALLKKEGGAAGLSPILKLAKDFKGVTQIDVEDILDNDMKDVKKHRDGDYILKENEVTDDDDESMENFTNSEVNELLDIISKYVEDPDDAQAELDRFDQGGFDAMSDMVTTNLLRDPEYKAWYNKVHSIGENETSITPNMGSLVKARLDTYRDAEDALKGQPNLDIYLDSLRNDIKLNGHEGYIEFGGDDWVEDYEEYMADRA